MTLHRPLSALNEDSNTDDTFHGQTVRFPTVNKGRNRSLENIIDINAREQQHRSSSFSDEREKINKRYSDATRLDTITEFQQQTSINKNDYLQPYRSLNDVTNKTLPTTHTVIRKPNTSTLKPLRKKTKLNIIVEPSIPLSYLTVNDEQIHSSTRTTSSSSNQTTSRPMQKMKPKAITPLGHYPNQEQIRAHINRSVIERQHPPYLPLTTRKSVAQQMISFDASPSKVNNLLYRQQKQRTTMFHSSKHSLIKQCRSSVLEYDRLTGYEVVPSLDEELLSSTEDFILFPCTLQINIYTATNERS